MLVLLAAACGGSSGGSASAAEGAVVVDAAATTDFTDTEFAATRAGLGISIAGGDLGAVQGANPCERTDAAAPEPLTIGYIGPDLTDLAEFGLQDLVYDDPVNMIEAYVNQVNFYGGIRGRCVRLAASQWRVSDAASSFAQVCTRMASTSRRCCSC